MLSVLLVDDEPGQIIGFRKLLQRVRPSYRISSARNGQEAIKLCEEQTFDLIFTDIQMQVMNGLDFMEKLEIRSHTKVIVLSGYDYFDYAQKALSLGAFSYLLKPLDLDTLQDVLNRSEQVLELEAVKIKAYKERLLLRWIQGLLPEVDNEAKRILPYHEAGHVGLIRMLNSSMSGLQSLQKQLESFWKNEDRILSSLIDGHNPGIVMLIKGEHDDAYFQAMWEELVHLSPELELFIGISTCGPFADQLNNKVREAELASLQRFYEPHAEVFLASNTRICANYKPLINTKEESAVLEAIRNNDADLLSSLVTELLNRTLCSQYPLPDYLRFRCKVMLMKWIDEMGMPRESDEAYKKFLHEIEATVENSSSYSTLLAAIKELLLRIIQTSETIKLHRKDETIYQYLAYIDEHYTEDLSLEKIASHFDLSPNYFSQYFRSRLDINFTKYVTQVKLHKAKQLLENQSDKIYNIAAQIGYQEVKYFNRVFKKEFGITPEEYRRSVRMMRKK